MDGGSKLPNWICTKVLLAGFLAVFILAAVACNDRPAPMDPQEVHAFIEESVKAAVAEALVQFREQVSRQELREMVAEALANQIDVAERQELREMVAEAVANHIDVAGLGSKSVSESMAEGPSPVTKAEVDRLIQAEIAPLWDEVGTTSAQATEVAKNPTPTLTPTPTPRSTTPASTPNPTPGPTSTPSSDITLSPRELASIKIIVGYYLIKDGKITAQDLSKDARINEVRATLILEAVVDRGLLRRLGASPNVYYESAVPIFG